MAQGTGITWADDTFNPVWGCREVSPGCRNCYARALALRMGHDCWGPGKERRTFDDPHWHQPRIWDRKAAAAGGRRRVFCGSMCDIFEDHATVARARARLWPLIRATRHLDWLLLTKRSERIAACLPADWGVGYANVWLGASIESGAYARRADELRRSPAVVRWLSCEPALGPLDAVDLTGLHWVVYGGESGPQYRPHDVQWARDLRDRCRAAGVAFYYKQSPGHRPGMGDELDGVTIHELPAKPTQAGGPTGNGGELFPTLDVRGDMGRWARR
jgi:protein gp37